MIFKSKMYKTGDTRTIKRFAYFPTRINDDIILWWDYYISHEKYVSGRYCGSFKNKYYLPSDWAVVERTLIGEEKND